MAASPVSGIILAGDPIVVTSDGRVTFTARQREETSQVIRDGLSRWAATAHGGIMLKRFVSPEYEIDVTVGSSDAAGRAPQPGIPTLMASSDHELRKRYSIVLNPAPFVLPKGMTALPGMPATTTDVMAVAWAAEMLHILFYSEGISLPHHERADFQEQWRLIASELGFPGLEHGDEELETSSRARVVFVGGRGLRH